MCALDELVYVTFFSSVLQREDMRQSGPRQSKGMGWKFAVPCAMVVVIVCTDFFSIQLPTLWGQSRNFEFFFFLHLSGKNKSMLIKHRGQSFLVLSSSAHCVKFVNFTLSNIPQL